MSEYEQLKLDNQLCFPLYAASRLVTKLYQPLLKDLDLTYPQYLIMLVLWENDSLLVSDICRKLLLETNTLTPLLKRLEAKGVIYREKSTDDDRKVVVSLTKTGKLMKKKAVNIPQKLTQPLGKDFSVESAIQLRDTLKELIKLIGDL